MDKNYNGSEVLEFGNSWLFSPIVWGVLSDKYIRGLIETPFGYKKSLISDGSLYDPLSERVNNCNCTPDRICWELSNEQIFFTKDKDIIAKSIEDFIELNSNYDKFTDGNYPLKAEHIIGRFREIANEILKLDEIESPYFIFKNTSVDDSVERWFTAYNEKSDEYNDTPLSKMNECVTEFVVIENNNIKEFITNLEYPYNT
jgi:hypothetical protein